MTKTPMPEGGGDGNDVAERLTGGERRGKGHKVIQIATSLTHTNHRLRNQVLQNTPRRKEGYGTR